MDVKNTEAMIELLKKELGPLADALGQGAGKTFEIFVRQAWVNAIQSLLWIPVGVISIIIGIFMFKRGSKKDKWGGAVWGGGEWFALIGALIAGLVMILMPIAVFVQVKLNPEYTALKLMIDTFKNSP